MGERLPKKNRVSPWVLIISGFAALILIGTVLLMLPFSSRDGHAASLGDAAFTATSAVF